MKKTVYYYVSNENTVCGICDQRHEKVMLQTFCLVV